MVLSVSRGSAPPCPLPTVRGTSDAPYRVMRGLPSAETPAVTGAATSTNAPQCRQNCRPSWTCPPQALQYCMTPPFGIERLLVRRILVVPEEGKNPQSGVKPMADEAGFCHHMDRSGERRALADYIELRSGRSARLVTL